MGILVFLLRRSIGMLAVMAGVSVITFAISHVIPADPVAPALGDHARDDQIAAFRAEYGLDKPVVEQYLIYVSGLLHGDLGIAQAGGNEPQDFDFARCETGRQSARGNRCGSGLDRSDLPVERIL